MTTSTVFTFDYFNQAETPNISLANPDGTLLFNLGTIYDREVKLRYNSLGEFTFTAPSKVDGVDTDYYSWLDYRRLINVENVGVYIITDIKEENDGIIPLKKITAQSLDGDLSTKKLTLFKGTYKFYDVIDPNPTLLGKILQYIPGWTIADVDVPLSLLYRTFKVTDKTIYSFLMTEVSQAYQCIFTFDTINRTISAHAVPTATLNTDIYLSYDNLVEKIQIKTITDELITALSVYGGGDLSVSTVNPLGTNTIYNFTYYKTTDWMSSGLISALTTWETKVTNNQVPYANLLTLLKESNIVVLALQGELGVLLGELAALEAVQKVRIQQGLSISAINTQITAKKAEITAKQAAITAAQAVSAGYQVQLVAINTDLSFDTNFTIAQQTELSRFILGNTYTNANFIQTDTMTMVEIQEEAQDLYDQAVQILAKVSQPRYEFELDAVNFAFLKEYQLFINELSLGGIVTLEIRDNVFVNPVLLGIDYSYDNPENFKLIFGNRFRLDDSSFQFSDLYAQSVDSGITTAFNSEMWSNFQDNYQNDVSQFLTSALDASKNAVINGSNQEFLIDANGLRGRYLDPVTGLYAPEQFWMINNLLAFTKDSWNSCSLALGKILTPSGVWVYGLASEALIGNLIAGNELYITNETSTFSVSGSRVTIIDGEFTLTRSDANSRIFMNPDIGIKIQKRVTSTGSYIDQFYVDNNGNVIFAGDLSGASGYFSGAIYATLGKIGTWTIDNLGMKDDFGNYIYGNGKVRLGMLTIDGSNATFNGNIYAHNLQGLVQYNQIGSVNADTIVTGTLSAIDIYGSNIYWPGVRMYQDTYGRSLLSAEHYISMIVGEGTSQEAGIGLTAAQNGGAVTIYSSNFIRIGGLWGSTQPWIAIMGQIMTSDPYGNSGHGISGNFAGLNFVNGIMTGGVGSGGGGGGTSPYITDFGWSFIVPVSGSTTGVAGYVEVPFDCRIDGVSIAGNVSGTAVVDIWSSGSSVFPPTITNTITSATPPTLASQQFVRNTTLTGWTRYLPKGNWLAINLNSASVVSQITVAIQGKRI